MSDERRVHNLLGDLFVWSGGVDRGEFIGAVIFATC